MNSIVVWVVGRKGGGGYKTAEIVTFYTGDAHDADAAADSSAHKWCELHALKLVAYEKATA